MFDDHSGNVAGRRADRHPNADVVGLLRDRVGHDAIDAEDRQRQPQAGKHGEECEVEARTSVDPVVQHSLDCPDIGDRLISVDPVNLAQYGASDSGRVRLGEHHDTVRQARQREGQINLRHHLVREAAIQRVFHHSNDLKGIVL